MVLPLLFSMGLPALAGSGALGATLGAMSVPALAGIGAGLGSFVQTGDIGKGIQTGLASFLGGKVLGGLSGSTSAAAQGAVQGAPAAAAPTGSFLQAAPGQMATDIASQGATGLGAKLLGPELATKPFFDSTIGGAVGLGQQAFMPAMIGQTMTDAQMMQEEYKNRAADDGKDTRPPMPNPMVRTLNPDPHASGGGEGLYFQYQRRPRMDGTQPEYPYYYADGGIMSLAEGGEVEVDEMMEENGMNEKDVIVESIKAIKGMSEQPEIVLAMFVQKYGEEALRDLVGRVQSGEFDETVARFEEGDKGMVKGPGDGSGVDDMVPATLEGGQDVLLSDGEFVLRKKTTDALEKAYGGGFLDVVNRAEEDAPKKLEQMVG